MQTPNWTPEMVKLHSRWTPKMVDRFESDVRELLKMNDQLTEQEREDIVTALKKRALDDLRLGEPR
jgi:hypothetical protein